MITRADVAGAGAKEPRAALGAKRVFGGFREREGRGRARRLREALDLASFRAGEPTSRQGLRVEVGARRGDRDGEIRDAHLVAAREAPRDCTAVIRAVERSLFSGRDQDGRIEPLPARRRTVKGGRARRAGRDAARRPGIRHVPGATHGHVRISIQLTLIEVKKFSNLDDTDRPCWIPALSVRRDTRVRFLATAGTLTRAT